MKRATVHTIESIKARTVEEGECWLWTGYAGVWGTPKLYFRGAMTPVRKALALLEGRDINAGGFFAVNCGTVGCVCPAHIVQRHAQAHMQAISKAAATGRSLTQRSLKTAQTRQRNSAKLTMEAVRAIRASDESGPALGRRYGISKSMVGLIKRGKQWKDAANPFARLGGRA